MGKFARFSFAIRCDSLCSESSVGMTNLYSTLNLWNSKCSISKATVCMGSVGEIERKLNVVEKEHPSNVRKFISQDDLLTITIELFGRFCCSLANFHL